ncbi:MAG TPA: response regulator [Candidatus Paceibacterota bacterium]
MKVLVVEDEVPLAKTISAKLKINGFDTTVAFDGLEAIELLKAEKFNFVVLDLIMPRADGFQVLEEMQKMDHKPPVFVMTALSQPEDEKRALNLGAVVYLRKETVSLKELIDKIKAYIGK